MSEQNKRLRNIREGKSSLILPGALWAGLLFSTSATAAPTAEVPQSEEPARTNVAPPSTEARPLTTWDKELPPVSVVLARIQGANPEDTKAQQWAALEVLDFYIKIRMIDSAAKGERAGPLVGSRMNEYVRAKTRPPHPGAAAYLNRGLSYHREVLTKLLSPASVRAYRATAAYKQLQVAERATRRGSTAPSAGLAPANAPPTTEVGRWNAEVRQEAASANTDLSVLGIQLAAPLALPSCTSVTPSRPEMADPTFSQALSGDYWAARGSAASPTPTTKCNMGQQDSKSTSMATQLMALAGVKQAPTLPGGSSRANIYFPPEARPSWFSPGVMGVAPTLVSVIVAEGQAAAVEITWLRPATASIVVETVRAKFATAKEERRDAVCSNAYGATAPTFDLTWTMPGLIVTYSLGCADSSSLTFETKVMENLRNKAHKARMAAEPKL